VSEGFEGVEVTKAGGAGSTGLKGTILHWDASYCRWSDTFFTDISAGGGGSKL
jgi:hypothetical protein